MSGKAAAELAARCRQGGVGCHAVVGRDALCPFAARILDLAGVVEVGTLEALRDAGRSPTLAALEGVHARGVRALGRTGASAPRGEGPSEVLGDDRVGSQRRHEALDLLGHVLADGEKYSGRVDLNPPPSHR